MALYIPAGRRKRHLVLVALAALVLGLVPVSYTHLTLPTNREV